jgi:hypothetical protein
LGALGALAIVAACETHSTAPVESDVDLTPAFDLAEDYVPFACTGEAFVIQDAITQLYQVDQSDPITYTYATYGPTPTALHEINNIGFDALRNIIWGWHRTSPTGQLVQQVVTIDGAGTVTPMGRGDLPTPNPNTATQADDFRFFAGDVSVDGSVFHLNWNGGGGIYTVNLPDLTKVYNGTALGGFPQITENGTICTNQPENPCGRVSDWAAHPNGWLYGGNDKYNEALTAITPERMLAILDPETGQRTDVDVALNNFTLPSGRQGFGAAWLSPSLNLFLLHNTGVIYEIDLNLGPGGPTDVSPVIVSKQTNADALASTKNDGAACVTPDPKIQLIKTADPTELPAGGGDVTYTYTISNLSDVEVTLTSLVDNVLGDLDDDAGLECSPDPIGQTLQPSGQAGDTFVCTVSTTITQTTTNVAEACGRDAANIESCDEDDATVTVGAADPSIVIEKSTNGEDADVQT